MTDREAEHFLHAIAASPDDDAPRLLYADWLEERGTPESVARAAFVRLQCLAARPSRDDPAGLDAELEAAALERKFADAWTAELQPFEARAPRFERGALAELEIPDARFLEHADELFELVPTWTDARFVGAIAAPRPLLAHPAIARLRGLSFVGAFGDEGASSLAQTRSLASLKRLELSDGGVGDAGIAALAASEYLGGLEELDLSRNRFGVAGATALVGSRAFPSLRRLTLADALDAAGVAALADSEAWPRLESLDLSGVAIDGRAATALASGALLRPVRRLTLDRCLTDPGALATLLAGESLAACEELRLNGLELGFAGFAVTIFNRIFPRLKVFEYGARTREFQRLSVTFLRGTQSLESLRISRLGLTDEGVGRLAATPHRRLRRLSLPGNEIGPLGARRLAQSEHFGPLWELELDDNPVGTAGARAIAGGKGMSSLRRLSLKNARINERGAEDLAASGTLAELRRLDLAGVWLDDRGKTALAFPLGAKRLVDVRW